MTEALSPAQSIAAGYAFTSTSLELGSVSVDGQVDPAAAVRIPLAMMNRHGLVAGATGTGKTKTLQLLAQQLSANGVPVVMADIKGDLSGLSRPGSSNDKIVERSRQTGDDWQPTSYPVEFVSLGSTGIGVPIRATITSFGPILLSKVLGLNATQESTLGLIFHWADKKGLPLLDLKDLRSVIAFLTSDEGKEELKNIGGVSRQTAGVILRALTNLEADGGDTFFGEPEIEPADLIRLAPDGRGIVTLFELGAQSARPVLFSTFLMWILADLFQYLPEVGDLDKPKLVFIFDESHVLFDDASKAFSTRWSRRVSLQAWVCSSARSCPPTSPTRCSPIRRTHPARVRAFTPDDQKALKKTVKTYPVSEVYKLEQALTSLGTGEAVVTVLSEKGAPTPVAWTVVRAPRSSMEAIGDEAITAAAKASPLYAKYGQTIDRESAYEKLAANTLSPGEDADTPAPAPIPVPAPAPAPAPRAPKPAPEEPGILTEVLTSKPMQSFLRSAASAAGREFSRAIFGTGRRRKR